MLVEGRRSHVEPYGSVPVPSGVAHSVQNASTDATAILHTAFASAASVPLSPFKPRRNQLVRLKFTLSNSGL